MINTGVKYNVTGRYMDGQKVIGYHLVGEDGSQAQESKDRVVYLIEHGIIANMRVQNGLNNEIILRGYGINLNKLPVFDMGKNKFRDDTASQSVANSDVRVNKTVDQVNPMGQLRITRRIMCKTQCIGYEVMNHSGRVTRKNRDSIITLASQKLICNAVVQNFTHKDTGKTDIMLRGVNCDLTKLPILIVNSNGQIIDPTKSADKLSVRVAYMKYSGIIYDTAHNSKIPFRHGDFIVCEASGKISIHSKDEVDKSYEKDDKSDSAVCDDYLTSINNYSIEVFGSKTVELKPDTVKRWLIYKPKQIA